MNTNERNKYIEESILKIQDELNFLLQLLENTKVEADSIESTVVHKKEADDKVFDESTINIKISNLLSEFNIPKHLDGYFYLRTALIETLRDPSLFDSMTKLLYPKVAKIHNSKPSRIERGMRHAIGVSSEEKRAPQEIKEKYLGYNYSSSNKPSNSEFLAALLEYIKMYLM